ncbi:hypothetical protein ACIREO_23750 [Streptomyces sp. NPDC102441]|uniref:hypothetical protein n=1 Tax=Streptomyces sp. NPDC102441 TaxID=3366176 RepID=UPI0038130A1C
MPLDLSSPGSLDREPHYRRYLAQDGKVRVVCVQDFDYYDYDVSRFVDEATFPTSGEAESAPISTWQLVQALETGEDDETRAQASRNLDAVRVHVTAARTAPGHRPQCSPRDCRCACPRTQDCQDCHRCVCWRASCCAEQYPGR